MAYYNIDQLTLENNNYRQVIYTTPQLQLVCMSLDPNVEIGMEKHDTITQFISIVDGEGVAIIGNNKVHLYRGISVIIPQGIYHNIINTSYNCKLKLYTTYSPPEHPYNLVQRYHE